ncbi:hypothetical protein [Candidatus Finniella inopinata]|uniref:Uncharacterized protein n=1 Tax=Candidatus Finniella inopinata TaxID=1696036 RepID=A0A4Q7DIP6_9PROT|nr:hypothetical protein [Candidatus Finniella inopinata]RZI46089.1 hypothetical protein EQU50_03925 [Candidatus Finniella inopinata]
MGCRAIHPDLSSRTPSLVDAQSEPHIHLTLNNTEDVYAEDSVVETRQSILASPNSRQYAYQNLKTQIEDRKITDEKLLNILFARWLLDPDLDKLHLGSNEPSLACVLMKVIRPYDAVYDIVGISKDADKDVFKGCFRQLGNEIFQLGWSKHDYEQDNIFFNRSRLYESFSKSLHDLKNMSLPSDMPVQACCTLQ